MKQNEIWQVYLDPVIGSEQRGNRPVVIISGDAVNENLDVVIVCPLTTSVHHFEGHPVLSPTKINGLKKESEVLIFHIRSVSKNRFKKRLGKISNVDLDRIKKTLNDILKY